MLVGMVDVIFSDVAQPDQFVSFGCWKAALTSVAGLTTVFADSHARILALNASYLLKAGGHFVISIKENCIDLTVPSEAVSAKEVKKLQADQFKPAEQVTLKHFKRDHASVVGGPVIMKYVCYSLLLCPRYFA